MRLADNFSVPHSIENRYILHHQQDNVEASAAILPSHLHNLALSENIGLHKPNDTERAISDAISALWKGLAP